MSLPRSASHFTSSSRALRAFAFAACVAAAWAGSGCTHLRYVYQAGRGQLELFNRSRPIQEVLADERTPPRLKKLLAEIPAIKSYGESMGLKPTSNYKEYVHLDRPAAVWVVSACAPLKFESRTWGFPIVGEFPYLGWFDLEQARSYARELKDEGLDVDLRGATAYSTLGWFRDPVLSSMIPEGEEASGDLVNVVLHESVHATYYVNGQAYLNESVASFVADRLTPEYLRQSRGKDAPELKAWVDGERSHEERGQLLHAAYEELARLYASSQPDAEKLSRKREILDKLQSKLYPAPAAPASKPRREITNATLIQFKTYNVGEREFGELLSACGGDWKRFWASLRTLDSKSFKEHQQVEIGPVISALAKGGCRG